MLKTKTAVQKYADVKHCSKSKYAFLFLNLGV